MEDKNYEFADSFFRALAAKLSEKRAALHNKYISGKLQPEDLKKLRKANTRLSSALKALDGEKKEGKK